MFFNRVYFTTRQSYRSVKNQNAVNRKFTTFYSPGGGQGGPNFNYIVTVFALGSWFYCVNKNI